MAQTLERSSTRTTKPRRAPAPHGLSARDWRVIRRVRSRLRAISMSYYAILYAANAALATKGLVAKSRAGTDSLSGFHFVVLQELVG
jgi:hypothetical protein